MNGPMSADQLNQWVILLVVAGIVALIYWKRPWRPSSAAHGTAHFASDEQMKRAGMMAGSGLLLGRTLGKEARPLHMMRYCHLSLYGAAGSGKGVSYAIPWGLTWNRGSIVFLDPKGELYRATAERRRQMGQVVVRLDPFGVCGKGADTLNVLDLIGTGVSGVDDCRPIAEALVPRMAEEHDPYWNDQAANVITGALACLAAKATGPLRSLTSLRDVITQPGMYEACAKSLQAMGGVHAALGGVMLQPQEKERSSLQSSVNRHTTFLDSPAVARAVQSGWDARELLTGNIALYLILPAHQLEAQSRWLRLVISSLLRLVGREGMGGREALFVMDEAGQLGHMQPIEQGLTLLRASGLRMVLMYQSLGQLRECWKEKESVLLDNTDQVYLGAQGANAKTLSERIGNYTERAESYSENEGTSRQYGAMASQGQGVTVTSGSNVSTSVHARALLTPDEIERLPPIVSIAFIRGLPPVICKRVLYYSDPLFTGRKGVPFWLKAIGLAAWLVLMVYLASLITPYLIRP